MIDKNAIVEFLRAIRTRIGTLAHTRFPAVAAWIREFPAKFRTDRRYQGAAGVAALTLLVGGGLVLRLVSGEAASYDALLEQRIQAGVFQAQKVAYSAPHRLHVGDPMTAQELVKLLKRLGYAEGQAGESGAFIQTADAIAIDPTETPSFSPGPATIEFDDGKIRRITQGRKRFSDYELRPRVLTALADADRTRRTLVRYSQLPPSLVQAVLAIEDHRFFDHGGLDLVRTSAAALEGLLEWERPRGTSTLTQQLARGLLLSRERTYSRKWKELLVARSLERRYSKEEILELYCNLIYMGRQGSYDVAGMGEAARMYFSKDVEELELHEAALLAGLIQRPSYLNPFRYPERARDRRDTVLRAMHEYGDIDDAQLEAALAKPVSVVSADFDSQRAPHFVDLVRLQLEEQPELAAAVAAGGEIHTTLVPELQEIAMAAVREGMKKVDEALAKQKRFAGKDKLPRAECALVAIDPETGDVVALVGSRDYTRTQLNRALAKRQPGSSFKPFVYAAAFAKKPEFGPRMTPLSIVANMPLQITIENEEEGDEIYQPTNYGKATEGFVTFREALTRSLNIPTVRVAKFVGYKEIAQLARDAGMSDVGPTPSAALGAYEVSPLELAGAYSIFVNGGERVTPRVIRSVNGRDGKEPIRIEPERAAVLDEASAFMVTDMMADVLDRGTGFRARSGGFWEPAAGKTGTDDDGWFAGFTNRLLCVVWVGFDDNTDLKLDGGESALPIWGAFMQGATELGRFRDPGGFEPPEGVVKRYVRPEIRRHLPPDVKLPDMELYFDDEEGDIGALTPVVIEIQPDDTPPEEPKPLEPSDAT